MTPHRTGTRDEGLAARLARLAAEKALTRRGDALARRRQELPWVRIDQAYRFETDEGRAALADRFHGRSQLLVYHFMCGPDYAAGCPACSAIVPRAPSLKPSTIRATRPAASHRSSTRPRRRLRALNGSIPIS
jgi:predicted dithiol-disulfide oxidoreductase (DUF899 family)